jgi:hypothetical protein
MTSGGLYAPRAWRLRQDVRKFDAGRKTAARTDRCAKRARACQSLGGQGAGGSCLGRAAPPGD